MQQLTGLDAAFLAMETPSMFGHVGSLAVLDPSTAPEPFTLDRLSGFIESRLHLLPPLRRRLVNVPLGLDQPYWIEDPNFDIEFHVRELALPKPGDERQLGEQVARLHARPLDRRHPLWELYLVHGLAGGRIAIYTKIHHAAIDGVSGNELLAVLLDTTPDGPAEDADTSWTPEPEPHQVALLARSAVSLTGHPVRAVRLGVQIARAVPSLLSSPGRPTLPVVDRVLRRDSEPLPMQAPLRAPKLSFNAPITPHRRWAFRTIALAEVKTVKNAFGVTVNDVVMALCAGALRHWLLDHDELPDTPLVAAVPVSVRSEDDRHAAGNRVSAMIPPLPTNIAEPADRLRAVSAAMQAAKDQHGALPANLLADISEFAMPALAGQAARLAATLRLLERVNPFNLFISNVPGPDVTLYYAGAELLAIYPLSAIADGQGLNITLLGYRGGLHFGLISCRELVPDLEGLAGYLVKEHEELLAAAAGAAAG